MADIQDVLDTIVTQVTGYLYPNGTANPPVAGAGATVRVYSDWPTLAQLNTDLPAGISHVTVYPFRTDRNTTRYAPRAHVQSITAATLTLASAGASITVGGAMPVPFTPHNLAVLIGDTPFVYAVQASDTLSSIATGIATLLALAYPGTTSSGAVVSVPAGVAVRATRVGTTAGIAQEWERQQHRIQISVWAPDIATRKAIGAVIKTAFAPINFLTMPDGFGARIQYHRTMLWDENQNETVRIYRRDLFYEVEYATTTQQEVATVVAFNLNAQTPTGDTILQQAN
jgi:hypothetical protein